MEKKNMGNPVLMEIENEIAVITLNRPEKRNAINSELLIYFYNYLEEISNNDAIKAAILTGNGKSFCAGLDLTVIESENLFDPRNDGKDLPDLFENCKKPIIGAINGHAITGGFEIALNCDFLIASENASFADTHAKVGIHPGWGMSQLLQKAIGQPRAKQISLTCQFVSAEKALQYGLVNEIVPQSKLLPRAKQIATEMCAVNQATLKIVKDLIEYKNKATLQDALTYERKGFKAFIREFSKKTGKEE
jgi:enoyl-CoA hydratase